MNNTVEGVNFHRRRWQTAEWIGGVVFLCVVGYSVFRGVLPSTITPLLSLGMNAFVIGRTLYKRGRSMMESSISRGEFQAFLAQIIWNLSVTFAGKQSPIEMLKWCSIAYAIFCICRGIAKQRTGQGKALI